MPLRVERQVVEILCALAGVHEKTASVLVEPSAASTTVLIASPMASIDAGIAAGCGVAVVYGRSGSVAAGITIAAGGTTHDIFTGLGEATISVGVEASAENMRLQQLTVACGTSVAAAVLHVAVASAEVACGISPIVDALKASSAAVSTVITVETQVAVQCVFNRASEVEVQTVTEEIDLTDYLLVDVITGLDCAAVVNQDHTLTATQPIGIHGNAARTRVRADGIELAASAAIATDAGVVKNATGSVQVASPVTVAAVVDQCLVGVAVIAPACSATVNINRVVAAECVASVDVSLTYSVIDIGIEFQYHPFVGTGPASNPTPPATALSDPLDAETGCQFVYPATGTATDTLTLLPPQLGNRDRLSFTRILTESRGGTLIAYADVTWPKTHTLAMTFSALTLAEKNAVLAFLAAHMGQEVGFMDWERRYWHGVVLTPSEPVVEDRRGSYTVNVEFEGEVV